MKRNRNTAIAILIVAGTIVPFAAPAEATCPQREIRATPDSAPAGATIHVAGEHFAAACNDVVVCQVGQPCPTPAPPAPATDIDLAFKQGGKTWPLTTVSARSSYRFDVDVTVPDDARPGPARIVADGNAKASFTVALPATGERSSAVQGIALLCAALALGAAASRRLVRR